MDLRTWRKRNGLTGAQLAELCGVAYSTLAGYENGSRRPRPKIAQRIEAATNGEVSAAELLGIVGTLTAREDPASFAGEPSVTIPIPERLLALANEQGLDVPALIAEGGIERLEQALRDSFSQRHRKAIEANRQHIDAHGTFGERMGAWRRM